MSALDFTRSIVTEASPEAVYAAVGQVSNWWSEMVEGPTKAAGDEFVYRFKDLHYSKQRMTEALPGRRAVWLVTDSCLSFAEHKDEWTGTSLVFDISREGDKTRLHFSHQGLTPDRDCYDACSKGWSHYIDSLFSLVTTGQGWPDRQLTVQEVADRFNELAQQEKWFEIQDELFAEDVRSIEPSHSRHPKLLEGKAAVRKKGEDWVGRVETFHEGHTTAPLVGGNFFAAARKADLSVQGIGRMKVEELMVYEVRNGRIVSEQFFY